MLFLSVLLDEAAVAGTILIRNDNRTTSPTFYSTLQLADSQLHAGCITLLLTECKKRRRQRHTPYMRQVDEEVRCCCTKKTNHYCCFVPTKNVL